MRERESAKFEKGRKRGKDSLVRDTSIAPDCVAGRFTACHSGTYASNLQGSSK